MRLTLPRILGDAWAILRGDHDLILRIVAPFVFLPAFAVGLLTDPPPALPAGPRDQAAVSAWLDRLVAWGQDNAGWYVLADVIGIYGLAALTILLVDRARPDVRAALSGAGMRIGRFVLASLLVAIPVGLGLWVLILPGLYVQARLAATLPALVAEAPLGSARAVGRSWRLTAGEGWSLLAAVVTLFIAQYLVLTPMIPADVFLRGAGHGNPFVLALVDAVMAAAAAGYHLGLSLIGIVAYRRLASKGI